MLAVARTLERDSEAAHYEFLALPGDVNLSPGFRAVRHDGETQLGLTDGSSSRRRDSIAHEHDYRDLVSDGIGVAATSFSSASADGVLNR
ncbi:MAG: hypothetical protein EOP05_10010 [Proteobacteria bacterium]|nr:MAG: hypothetical protein EOP05_10010 [Pseudomonadota bacterium]